MAYNGWKNYETWAVYTWLTNEEGSERAVREKADEFLEGDGNEDAAARELAEWLKEDLESGVPEETDNTVYGDLLGAALSEVDWYELAEAFLEG